MAKHIIYDLAISVQTLQDTSFKDITCMSLIHTHKQFYLAFGQKYIEPGPSN
jgi:hypothetical protein